VSAAADAFDLELDPAAFGPGERAMVARLYRDVVAAMAADPEGDPGAVSLTEAERVRVLVGFHPPPGSAAAPFQAVADRVAVWSRSRPEAAAIVLGGGERLSRLELDRRSGELAARLRQAGAGPEVRVGVLLRRTAALASALLGVLRSGAAYVPLDPGDPDSRIRTMVRQADIELIVTSAATRHRLPPGTRGVVLEEIASGGPHPLPEVRPEQLAYAIFTSGSTGVPKGVAMAHRALATHLASIVDRYELGETDRVLQFAPATFDVSLEQLLAPLTAGAAVVMRGEDPPVPAALLDLMDAEGVTVAELTPQYWYQVLDELERRRAVPRALRLLLLGGEAAAGAQLERWRRLAPGVRTMNTYGPTEAAITPTTWELGPGPVAGVAPIGRPLPHVRAYVLDPDLRPVTTGVAGELCLAGAGLARGYLGRPGVTAAAFVADPYGTEPGGRLYRTGDRARWAADGTLEFLGRMDDQVKVRGFRVEPGEAAAALRGHPAVAEALVLGRPDPSGDGVRLVAYVTPAPGATPEPSELRSFLRAHLPPHMVPAAFVVLAELPLTGAGKVDRAALPAPEDRPEEASGPRREPATATERWLADTLAEVLGCAQPSVDDDFFALGGHSLALLRLAARVRERFGIELQFRTVFEHSSIESLAPLLDGRPASGSDGAP
ncbi:MAG TPA: non-ribosomal peptide synthetase, partial [Candidatus Dormibacteraeota bacterium]|nr:non-ribosomal peptide synthetase [Candidatus Dormibacteraeota bacterium]